MIKEQLIAEILKYYTDFSKEESSRNFIENKKIDHSSAYRRIFTEKLNIVLIDISIICE